MFHFSGWLILKKAGRAFSVEFISLIHSAYFTCRIIMPIMPFRKSCPMTSRKLVPPFTRSEVKSHGADVWRESCIRAFKRQNMTRELGRRGKAYINSVYFLSLIHSSIYSCLNHELAIPVLLICKSDLHEIQRKRASEKPYS